jgi:hypothetical protein
LRSFYNYQSIIIFPNEKIFMKQIINIIPLYVILSMFLFNSLSAQQKGAPVTAETPSFSQYFSWINNTNEGTTTEQSLINLEFFQWMNREYGMVLDIYAFDAGAIDGAGFYGSMKSDRFRRQFPEGFNPMVKKAAEMDTRLGIWGGPDGFGNTPEEARERTEQMVSLCRDHNFQLFKFDGVCGHLRPQNFDYFDQMMTKCREYTPDLILLNHRLDLGPGTKHSTTFLLGGMETYIDVSMSNEFTATHNRACALSREVPENLIRMTEDHGVCLSSCLDYWEDDLILQAFNRSLILAPQLYGSPWFLKDEEFPKLAFIFNLHREYRDILLEGMILPEAQYGPGAVSRGNEKTRLITLRNLTWEPVTYKISLDESIGLKAGSRVELTQYHPYIQHMGTFRSGNLAEIKVLPFRSCLIKVSSESNNDFEIKGIPYEIVRNVPGKPVEVKLLGMPGRSYNFSFEANSIKFKGSEIEGSENQLYKGKSMDITFGGESLKHDYHRFITAMNPCEIPKDAESLYYATAFAASNDALEVRSLERSGETKIPEVKRARDAFFEQEVFVNREIWDKFLFDGDEQTAFSIANRHGFQRIGNSSAFLLDMGEARHLDKIVLKTFDDYSLQPLKPEEALHLYVSDGMSNWKRVEGLTGTIMEVDLSHIESIRYVRIAEVPTRLTEIEAYANGKLVDRDGWKANNLFRDYYQKTRARKAWSSTFELDEIPKNSYLCVAVNGKHGYEGAMASFKIDGEYTGCPDRSPSFLSNFWESPLAQKDKNYTFYLPLTPDMKGKKIEAFVMAFNEELSDLKPEIWISAYPIPFEEKTLILNK